MGRELILPKNIRQIGDIQGKEKIFLEDYVMTYIKKKENQEREDYLGIFLGERQEKDDTAYVFIRGILEVPEQLLKEQMEKEYQEYFPNWEIQGCCVIGQYPAEKMRLLSESFPEAGELIYHLQDQEETIYRVENGRYRQIKGYFVFYEQNRLMQEYMSSVFSEDRVEKEGVSDKAIRSFRKKVKEKGVQKNTGFLKMASSFFVVAVLAVGAVMVNRIGEMRSVVDTGDTTVENEVVYVEDMADAAADDRMTPSGTAVDVSSENGIIPSGTAVDVSSENGMIPSGTVMDVSSENSMIPSGTAMDVSSDHEVILEEKEENSMNVNDSLTGMEQTEELAGSDAFWNESSEEKSTEQQVVQEVAAVRQMQAAYVIKEGDTLADICNRYYGNLNRLTEICELNEIADANRIMTGQKIVLP